VTAHHRTSVQGVLRPWPELQFPEALPVSAQREAIRSAICDFPVVIVCGETGSGKTTQLPKICALAGRGERGLIGHTQPRRLAATSVARRMAEELGTPLGTHVGYRIRFQETMAPGARVCLMTDGILLAETLGDHELRAYDTLIIDEAHERSLNIDFLLGYLKRLLNTRRRDDLKLIVTSATIDAERFARHFALDGVGPAPVIEVSGRLFPVDVRYQPPVEGEEAELAEQIEAAIENLWRDARGDVLVFLPGEREIREVAEHLRGACARAAQSGARSGVQRVLAGSLGAGPVEILPLFARLSVAEQQRVFTPSVSGRRIVLATNVAETSLTVAGIRYVIDSGLARIKRYRFRGKVEQLQIEAVSQAAANQRAGRCGRVMHGVCVRLYSEQDFNARPRFSDPEIVRSSLAAVVLRMKALQLGEMGSFPFLDPPHPKALADGVALLTELGALDERGELTPVGRQLARLPIDPRIARMLIAAHALDCLREVLIIASALAVQDPRERPIEQQQAADEMHRRFADERSDFLAWVRLWDYVRDGSSADTDEQQRSVDAAAMRETATRPTPTVESRRQRERRLAREFLHPWRLREWADVHDQLLQTLAELHLRPRPFPGTPDSLYGAVHQALLSGLLGNIGTCLGDTAQYQGTHEARFVIHPSSALARKTPRWIMAAEIVDTTRLFARTVARIDPGWIEQLGAHLLRRSWSDPHWERKAAQVVAFERATIYGLLLYSQRRVHYALHEPARARELLIREALVRLDWDANLPFMAHNRQLMQEVAQLEQRMRRPDLLADPEDLYVWFDQRIPPDVLTGQALQAWWRGAARSDPQLLFLPREALLRKQIDVLQSERFPRHWVARGLRLELSYRFDPGSSDDGVSLQVPLAVLGQVSEERCEWLVPGLLPEKTHALIKSLPQRLRRNMVPVQDWVRRFVAAHQDPSKQTCGLLQALVQFAREDGAVQLQPSDFRLEQLPAHLRMHFRVLDSHGAVLGSTRALPELKARFAQKAQGALQAAFAQAAFPQAASQQRQALAQPDTAGRSDRARRGQAKLRLREAERSDFPGRSLDAVHETGDTTKPATAERFEAWSFGELAEVVELRDGEQTLIGFPAVIDHGDAVGLQVFGDAQQAANAHRRGILRLLALHFREPLRTTLRQWPGAHKLSTALGLWASASELQQQLAEAILRRACLSGEVPRNRSAFELLCAKTRPRIGLIGQELGRLLGQILTGHSQLSRRLASLRGTHAENDVATQLEELMPGGFLVSTPAENLVHIPRYLQAIHHRIERLRADPARDLAQMRAVQALELRWRRALAARRGVHDEQLEIFRWMLQELRVSLFAQQLRTPQPVSVKRLERWWVAQVPGA
jgi:ATP-dependent helicase HrpA